MSELLPLRLPCARLNPALNPLPPALQNQSGDDDTCHEQGFLPCDSDLSGATMWCLSSIKAQALALCLLACLHASILFSCCLLSCGRDDPCHYAGFPALPAALFGRLLWSLSLQLAHTHMHAHHPLSLTHSHTYLVLPPANDERRHLGAMSVQSAGAEQAQNPRAGCSGVCAHGTDPYRQSEASLCMHALLVKPPPCLTNLSHRLSLRAFNTCLLSLHSMLNGPCKSLE
jgi:hypothetical protein